MSNNKGSLNPVGIILAILVMVALRTLQMGVSGESQRTYTKESAPLSPFILED